MDPDPTNASMIALGGQAPSPIEVVSATGSLSISEYGEPEQSRPANIASKVDETATASVDDESSEETPRARIKTAWAQAEADAAWQKLAEVRSPSLMFFGEPEKVVVKDAQPLPVAEVARFDPNKLPLVIRGGIWGGLFPEIAIPADGTAPAEIQPDDGTIALTPEAEAERIARRAKEREAIPAAPRQPMELSPREQSNILPN